jgi:hypothetical protein
MEKPVFSFQQQPIKPGDRPTHCLLKAVAGLILLKPEDAPQQVEIEN